MSFSAKCILRNCYHNFLEIVIVILLCLVRPVDYFSYFFQISMCFYVNC